MPRKGPAPKRPLVNDPVYESQLVTQLVNKVLLDGKKSVAERIVYGALEGPRQDRHRPGHHAQARPGQREAGPRGPQPPCRWRETKYSSSSAICSSSSAISSSGLRPVTSNTRSAASLMMRGARVVVLVDAMAEAHRKAVAGFHAFDERGNVLHVADRLEHPQDLLVRAAVQWPVEGRGGLRRAPRTDRPSTEPIEAHHVRAAILLVVGVEDEQHLERRARARGRPGTAAPRCGTSSRGSSAAKPRSLSGYTYGSPREVPIRPCGDRRRLGDQAAPPAPCARRGRRRRCDSG